MSFTAPDDNHFLDVLVSLQRACSFVSGIDYRRFESDPLIQSAVQHQLAIAGEAVKRLSLSAREQHSDIHWGEIAGMRDVLIHAYHRVSPEEVWRVVQEDAPRVIAYVDAFLNTPE